MEIYITQHPLPVCCRCSHFQIGMSAEHAGQTRANYGMIIDDQNACQAVGVG